MTTLNLTPEQNINWLNPASILRTGWASNKPLTIVGLLSFAWFAIALVGLIADPRTVLNEPLWLKPAKFGISITIYTFTFLWLLNFIEGWERTKRIISWITAIAFVFEIVPISLQAIRGTRSHFNNETPFDTALFSIMGIAIFTLWLMGLGATVLLMRQKIANRAWGWSLRLGLLVGVIGAGLGGLMTTPTDEQLAEMQATGQLTQYIGAHSVGVPDGGEGLPVVGWSTEGGDLRIGHFIGLHAMQIIPLIGYVIATRLTALSAWRRTGLVWTAAFGYAGIMGLTTWQALRGQPLLQPDGLTIGVAAALLIALIAAAIFFFQPLFTTSN